MYGNVTRLSGLISGMDTQSMVTQLMNAENLKMTKLRQSRQKLEWKQQAYRDVASNLKSFQTSFLSLTSATSMRLSSSYNTYKASVTDVDGKDTSAIKVSASSTKTTGTFSLRVLSVASKDTYIGNTIQMTYSTKVSGQVTEGEDGESVEEFNEYTLSGKLMLGGDFKVSLNNGASVKISLSSEEALGKTNDEIIDTLNAKLAQQFGYNTGKTGTLADQKVKVHFDDTTGQFSFVAGSGHTVKVSNGTEGSDVLTKLGFTEGGTTGLETSTSLETLGLFNNVPSGVDTLKLTINDKEFTVKRGDTVEGFMKQVNALGAGVTMSFDKLHSALKLESNELGAVGEITLGASYTEGTGTDAVNVTNNSLWNNLGFNKNTRASRASDAVFVYNNVTFTRESNSFSMDGVSITLTEEAKDKEFKITLDRDVSNAVKNIKTFVEEYNKLVDTLNKYHSTTRVKSGEYSYYEPLTDEQKASMSENEVKLWEEKAKTGILYRDDILTSLHQKMRSMMYAEVTREDGSTISLHQIGISTSSSSGYIGKLQIDEKKLTEALEKNGDAVTDLFTKSSKKPGASVKDRNARLMDEGLAYRLNDIIENTIGNSGSIYKRAGLENTASFTNNDLYRQLKKQDNKIYEMTRYLINRENHYYNLFAKMEAAMSQSNNQMSSLTSMMG